MSVLQYALPGLNFFCQNEDTPLHHSANHWTEDTAILLVNKLLKAGASVPKKNKVSNYLEVVVAEYDHRSIRPN